MTQTDDDDDTVEISEEELAEMVEEAIDIIALALPEDADDSYWAALRQKVERRAAEMLVEPDEDDDEA